MRLVCIFLLLILTLGPAACTRGRDPVSSATQAQAPEVRVVYPETFTLESSIPITGSLLSTVQVDVATEHAGRLVVAPPREGEAVTKGQVLARLDDTRQRLEVQQSRAAVAVAEAALERARVAVQHADREMERARQVQTSGGITVKDFQAAEWAARDARAQVRLAEAQLDQARQSLALAEKRLRDCVILAPVSGEVQAHIHNAGIYLDTGAILVRLVDNSRMELEATVPSQELGRLRPGQEVRFSVDAFPGQTFSARLLMLAPALLEQSRSVKLRVQVPNPDRKLKAGMFARGAIVTGVRPNALLLPASVLLRDNTNSARGAVLVAEGGVVRRREVELGLEQDGRIEIVRGLAGKEAVLADPRGAPAEGQRVRTVAIPPAVAPTPPPALGGPG